MSPIGPTRMRPFKGPRVVEWERVKAIIRDYGNRFWCVALAESIIQHLEENLG